MVTETGQVPFTLALKATDNPSRLCWEGEDGANELLLSLLTDNSSLPFEYQVSKTMLRSAGMPGLSRDLSGVTAMGSGQAVNSLSAPEAEV